jgi:hypothetical protein
VFASLHGFWLTCYNASHDIFEAANPMILSPFPAALNCNDADNNNQPRWAVDFRRRDR